MQKRYTRCLFSINMLVNGAIWNLSYLFFFRKFLSYHLMFWHISITVIWQLHQQQHETKTNKRYKWPIFGWISYSGCWNMSKWLRSIWIGRQRNRLKCEQNHTHTHKFTSCTQIRMRCIMNCFRVKQKKRAHIQLD